MIAGRVNISNTKLSAIQRGGVDGGRAAGETHGRRGNVWPTLKSYGNVGTDRTFLERLEVVQDTY